MEDNEDLETHVKKLYQIGWGGEPEIRAATNLYGRQVEIWVPGIMGTPTIRLPYIQTEGSIKLAYYPGDHYNALLKSSEEVEGVKDKDEMDGENTKPKSPTGNKEGPQSNDGQTGTGR
jgi:hypothetical protein